MSGTALRSIPADFDSSTVTLIDARLDRIERDDEVRIGLAIESGSRAWGFASPDSDYDCRFLYVRQSSDYLRLWPPRDVIETPLDAVLDVNGWDIAKALRLAAKGNAVIVEWLRSPIAYRGDADFRKLLIDFVSTHAPSALIRRHYLHLARAQMAPFAGRQIVAKKLFYLLRPVMALRWMRLHDGALPPMHFPTLVAESALLSPLVRLIEDLIAAKRETRELGRATVPAALLTLARTELDVPQPESQPDDSASRRNAADALFQTIVARFGP